MDNSGALLGGGIVAIIYLAVIIVVIAGMWKIFTKAGQPGWAAIIPIYNIIVLLEVAGKPLWWIILMLIPLLNIVIFFLVFMGVAEKFGQGIGFALGLFFLGFIFIPLLGFGNYHYQG